MPNISDVLILCAAASYLLRKYPLFWTGISVCRFFFLVKSKEMQSSINCKGNVEMFLEHLFNKILQCLQMWWNKVAYYNGLSQSFWSQEHFNISYIFHSHTGSRMNRNMQIIRDICCQYCKLNDTVQMTTLNTYFVTF